MLSQLSPVNNEWRHLANIEYTEKNDDIMSTIHVNPVFGSSLTTKIPSTIITFHRREQTTHFCL